MRTYYKLLEYRAECNGVFNTWWLIANGVGEKSRAALEKMAKEPTQYGERRVVAETRGRKRR